jgi:hypothetical protein
MNGGRDQFIADVAVKLDRMERRLAEIEELAKKVENAARNPANELWHAVSEAKQHTAELAAQLHQLEFIRKHSVEIGALNEEIVTLREAVRLSEEKGRLLADFVQELNRENERTRRRVDEFAQGSEWRKNVIVTLAFGVLLLAAYVFWKY